MTERTQGDVVGGPGSDPGQREEPGAQLAAIGSPVEHEVAAGQGRGETDQRPTAGPRHPEVLRRHRGHGRCVGEQVGEPLDVGRDGAAVGGDESRGRGARRHDGDLLPEDRPDGQLAPVDVAGDAQAGAPADERREDRIGAQVGVDRHGVGVGVEERPHPRHRGRGVAQVVEREPQCDVRRPGPLDVAELDAGDPGAVRQVERAGVPAGAVVLDLRDLDAGHGAVGEEAQQGASRGRDVRTGILRSIPPFEPAGARRPRSWLGVDA